MISKNKLIEALVIDNKESKLSDFDGKLASAAVNNKESINFSSELNSSSNDWKSVSANQKARQRINANLNKTVSLQLSTLVLKRKSSQKAQKSAKERKRTQKSAKERKKRKRAPKSHKKTQKQQKSQKVANR